MKKFGLIFLIVLLPVVIILACQNHSDSYSGHDHGGHQHVAEGKTYSAQQTCPVMGGEINREMYAEQDGKRIYVCCPGCIETIEQNFQKHVNILKESGQKPEVLGETAEQAMCPVMPAREITKDLYVEHDGQKIYVCCQGCIDIVQGDPEKYLEMVR
ncbi:hypothetical protein CHISP_3222 [Chitinispirillum alkaliphilum]|nr:hypothetical protein CHISP_3222 [Chitinispirillum alkaliphilum]